MLKKSDRLADFRFSRTLVAIDGDVHGSFRIPALVIGDGPIRKTNDSAGAFRQSEDRRIRCSSN